MAAGPRSLLAFWVGGAGTTTTTQAGVRSLLAPWVGGAVAEPAVETGGYRSLLGFWAGGASAGPAIEPPPDQQQSSGGGQQTLLRRRRQAQLDAARRAGQYEAGAEQRLEAAPQERAEAQRATQAPRITENAPTAPIPRPAAPFEPARKPGQPVVRQAPQAFDAEMLQRELRAIDRRVAEAKATAQAEEFQRIKREANNRRAQILIALMMLGQ